jgi:hypothetical protein
MKNPEQGAERTRDRCDSLADASAADCTLAHIAGGNFSRQAGQREVSPIRKILFATFASVQNNAAVWRNLAIRKSSSGLTGFRPVSPRYSGVDNMLETIAIVLIVLWALGLVTSYTMGGLIHILVVIAVVMILLRLIQGRRL